MLLIDVNVLVYAHRREAVDHERYRDWVDALVNGGAAYGMADEALSGCIRVVTHPRIFKRPSTTEEALVYAEQVRSARHCIPIRPGPRHWTLFTDLCRRVRATGRLVPDAWFAALAIESGSEWITTDRDFARFPGLRWRHPLDE